MINIIYCRVSNLKIESQSFSNQEKNCTEYCKKNNLRIKAINKEHNSGYGTANHLEAIQLYGITKHHRKTFGLCKSYSDKYVSIFEK